MGFRERPGFSPSLSGLRDRYRALLPNAGRILAGSKAKTFLGILIAIQLSHWASERSSRIAVEEWLAASAPSREIWERALESRGFLLANPETAHRWISSLPHSWEPRGSVWGIEGSAVAVFFSEELPPSVFLHSATREQKRKPPKAELKEKWRHWGKSWPAFAAFWNSTIPLSRESQPASPETPSDPRELRY